MNVPRFLGSWVPWFRFRVPAILSLGAGRWRIVRHLLVEGVVLAVGGAVAGVLVAAWVLGATDAVLPAGALPAEAMAALDWRALVFTAGLAMSTAVLASLLPAWRSVRAEIVDDLRCGGRAIAGSRGVRRVHSGLLAGEIALATVLVAGASLLVASFARLTSVDPGFAFTRLLTFTVLLPDGRASDDQRLIQLYDRILDGVGRLESVESAAAITSLPVGGWRYGTTFVVEGAPPTSEPSSSAHIQIAAGRYFETMGIPIVRGRALEPSDSAGAPRVLVVNQTFAGRFLGGDDSAVGRRIRVGGPTDPMWTVVGVMRNVKVGRLGDDPSLTPELYAPFAQSPIASVYFAVRTTRGDPLAVVPDVTAAVTAVDPAIPLGNVRTMADRLDLSVELQRFQMVTLSAFAGLALVMACLGVYAVRSQAVASRIREIGIRLALGSTSGQVLRLTLGQGAVPVGAGLLLGLGGAIYGAGAIERWLFETPATDPPSVVAAAGLIAAAALVAGWIPARRAARVDPMVTLRAD